MMQRSSRLRQAAQRKVNQLRFRGADRYWETRYRTGGDSGPGSYGLSSERKSAFLNAFVATHDIETVIEFGCGDGHQLSLATYPQYIGLDIAPSAIARCGELFANDPTKSFFLYSSEHFLDRRRIFHADLALSLDVIFHLVDDHDFEVYLKRLFGAADRYVIIYSTDDETRDLARHVKHRRFTTWVRERIPNWRLDDVTDPGHGGPERFYTYVAAGTAAHS